MSYQFTCPFCGVSMEADAMNPESEVQCPACAQSFVVEAPREPVRVKATFVHHPAQPQAPQARSSQPRSPQPRAGHPPPHRKGVRREEERAKFAMVALLVGGPLLLGGLLWGAVTLKDHREKKPPSPPSGPVTENRVVEEIRKSREKEAREKKEEEDEHARGVALAKEYAAMQTRLEAERKERERAALRESVAHAVFSGNTALADEAIKEFEAAVEEVSGLFYDGITGNEPDNPRAEIEMRFVKRLLQNRKIKMWANGRPLDGLSRIFGGQGFTAADGKPVRPDSIQGMLLAREYSGTGTGFWISRDGWLLTNAHVVGGSATVDISESSEKRIPARVVKTDRAKDLALLKAETTRPVWLPVTASDAPVGTPVFTAGFPNPMVQGLENKVTFGEINSLSGMRDNRDHYQCSVPVQPGNSGGALVESTRGWAVGVVFSRLTSAVPGELAPENVSYAIKPAVMRAFIESVPEAKPLLAPSAWPRPDAVGREQAIQRARDCAVLILVK